MPAKPKPLKLEPVAVLPTGWAVLGKTGANQLIVIRDEVQLFDVGGRLVASHPISEKGNVTYSATHGAAFVAWQIHGMGPYLLGDLKAGTFRTWKPPTDLPIPKVSPGLEGEWVLFSSKDCYFVKLTGDTVRLPWNLGGLFPGRVKTWGELVLVDLHGDGEIGRAHV